AFSDRVNALAADLPDFELMDQLVLSTVISVNDTKPSKSVSKRVCYVTQPIECTDWIAGDWRTWVDLMFQAYVSGIDAIPKTRATGAERAALHDIANTARGEALDQQPAEITKIVPKFLKWVGRQPVEERMFKLYQRIDGTLHYREAWIGDDSTVTEHWGICGTRGETRPHACKDLGESRKTYAAAKKQARADGYKSIPASRHASLVVEFPIDGFGTSADLDRRHALEDFLNEQTGWLGIGHVDGGSTGSDTMEVYCNVVDYEIARQAITEILQSSRFSDYARIYRA
ncbi:MAG: hypothetical protein OER56_17275, partial [Hyphomicrobiales bacterium]|nr:hypothetical protein [Hyphomicrobiales bacterium]